MAWPALKRALKTGEISIENLGEQHGVVATTSLRPEPIPLNVKVILIGHPYLYHLLHYPRRGLPQVFQGAGRLRPPRCLAHPRTSARYAEFICSRCRRENLPAFSPSGVARVVEFSSRLAGHRDKLSTRFNEIAEIIAEAGMWARQGRCGRRRRAGTCCGPWRPRSTAPTRSRSTVLEMIRRGTLLVDVDGEKVGQINGVALLQVGDYAFGKPIRITARCLLGNRGVINIEREADLSGRIHNKGVLILSHYLGGQFAQNKPLALWASLAFEQSYDEVEGDSASAAELYALLSELSGLPIDQGIAVTGSVNQKGEMQPIGGVNEKIEGFYHACKVKGLTGRQGVIIPRANVENLMLKEEVAQAVAEGRFHVWAVDRVDEGIEILTGVPAGRARLRRPLSRKIRCFGLVDRRLEDMAAQQVRFAREAASRKADAENEEAGKEPKTGGGPPARNRGRSRCAIPKPEDPDVPEGPDVPGVPRCRTGPGS